MIIYINLNKKKLNRPKFKRLYGYLYEELKTETMF